MHILYLKRSWPYSLYSPCAGERAHFFTWHHSSWPHHQSEANGELAGEKQPHKSNSAGKTPSTCWQSGEDAFLKLLIWDDHHKIMTASEFQYSQSSRVWNERKIIFSCCHGFDIYSSMCKAAKKKKIVWVTDMLNEETMMKTNICQNKNQIFM